MVHKFVEIKCSFLENPKIVCPGFSGENDKLQQGLESSWKRKLEAKGQPNKRSRFRKESAEATKSKRGGKLEGLVRKSRKDSKMR